MPKKPKQDTNVGGKPAVTTASFTGGSPTTFTGGSRAASNGLSFDEGTRVTVTGSEAFDMTHRNYTIFARVKSRRGGTIFSKTQPGSWVPGGKSLFIRNGRLGFDVGWVGFVDSRRRIDDDRWHQVALTYAHDDGRVVLFVDGARDGEGKLVTKNDAPNSIVQIGYIAPLEAPAHYFAGSISEVRFYQRALTVQEIAALAEWEPDGVAAVARWRLDSSAGATIPDETGHGHQGMTEVGEESIDSKQFDALLNEFAQGFTAKAVGISGSAGLAIVKEHLGRSRVLRTHPLTLQTPCVLESTIEVPSNKRTALALDVAQHPYGDWQLVVKANGEVLHNLAIGHATTGDGWAWVRVDLSRFAGQKVRLELLNQASGWAWEYGYWGRIEVVSESIAEASRLADAFVPLFNGRNFDGWNSSGELLSKWEVRDGAIHTTTNGRVYTSRTDYSDFHLRAELKADGQYSGNLIFRSSILPGRLSAYAVRITTVPFAGRVNTVQDQGAQARTGSLLLSTREPPSLQTLYMVDTDLIRPNEWFTLELIAIGPHFVLKLNGKEVFQVDDPDRTHKQGHIELHRVAASTGALYCRKIEIKEFHPGDGVRPATPSAHAEWLLPAGFPVPDQASTWSYTVTDPGRGWANPDFDLRSWKQGRAPFGTPGPGVKTAWQTPDIWLRGRVEMPALKANEQLLLYVNHDDDIEIFVNGKPLYHALGFVNLYSGFPLSTAQRSLFRPGRNAIAVRCHNGAAAQRIDIGLRLIRSSPATHSLLRSQQVIPSLFPRIDAIGQDKS